MERKVEWHIIKFTITQSVQMVYMLIVPQLIVVYLCLSIYVVCVCVCVRACVRACVRTCATHESVCDANLRVWMDTDLFTVVLVC